LTTQPLDSAEAGPVRLEHPSRADPAANGTAGGGHFLLTSGLRRRQFIALLGAAAVTPVISPRAAYAERPSKLPTIGFLGATTPSVWSPFVAAFLQRLRDLGWVDGRNIAIEYRWAEGRESRYDEFAAEFVRLKVGVIVTAGTGAVIAVKKATSTIPIVFAAAGDPVGTGLVASLPRPGGNLTGLSNEQTDLAGYRLSLLREIVPGLRRVALMGNVDTPNVTLEMQAAQDAAPKLDLEVFRLGIKKADDIVPAIEGLKDRADALYVCTDPLITTQRIRINTLALSAKLPTVYAFREYVQTGGLMSYGPNFPDLFRRAGDFVDKILRGAKPADIPVEQPTKFDLIVNLTSSKALGLNIPETFLARANEIIE
jgi:putative ABC transport system substrate-binding protein